MENQINGVKFKDWACACANLAAGMPEEEICRILKINSESWKKANALWAVKLGDLMAHDREIATLYGMYFTNPKQGKFTHVESPTQTLEESLILVPDFDTYQKIQTHSVLGSQYGMDSLNILKQYGLNLHTWSQVSLFYSQWFHLFTVQFEHCQLHQERLEYLIQIRTKWELFFQHYLANQN